MILSRVIKVGLFLLVSKSMIERRWTSSAFFVALIILQFAIPMRSRTAKLVQWVVVAAMLLLVILQVSDYLSR